MICRPRRKRIKRVLISWVRILSSAGGTPFWIKNKPIIWIPFQQSKYGRKPGHFCCFMSRFPERERERELWRESYSGALERIREVALDVGVVASEVCGEEVRTKR